MNDPFLNLYQENFLSGFCKGPKTKEYFDRILAEFPDYKSSSLYEEWKDLKIARLGFGCYRVTRENENHRDALSYALKSGVNLVDTSSNYADGASESLVGDVIRGLNASGEISREEIFVVTKIGYIQGRNMILADGLEKNGHEFPEVTFYSDDCWHSIHPEFLEDQLERSRKRLGLSVIDGLLLHNPEYFLMDREHHGVPEDKAKKEYYERRENAFRFLEKKRNEGIIRYYGISSNTFPVSSDAYSFTSLKAVWEISEKIRIENNLVDSGFSIIQFPANLYETGFVHEKNNDGISISSLAKEKGLLTLVNRPLNAAGKKGGMTRLAIYPSGDSEDRLEKFVSALGEFENDCFSALGIEETKDTFGTIIGENKDKFGNAEHLHFALNRSIIPVIRNLLERVGKLDLEKKYYNNYLKILNQGIGILEEYVIANSAKKLLPLQNALGERIPSLAGKPLSRQAVTCLLGSDGIGTVLIGMRKKEYVEDMIAIFRDSIPVISEENLIDCSSYSN
ncbi:MAG: aldo/keto reductase [Leptospira sp.]|nr:aldo/keto reductase [Leptospira sp.]